MCALSLSPRNFFQPFWTTVQDLGFLSILFLLYYLSSFYLMLLEFLGALISPMVLKHQKVSNFVFLIFHPMILRFLHWFLLYQTHSFSFLLSWLNPLCKREYCTALHIKNKWHACEKGICSYLRCCIYQFCR